MEIMDESMKSYCTKCFDFTKLGDPVACLKRALPTYKYSSKVTPFSHSDCCFWTHKRKRGLILCLTCAIVLRSGFGTPISAFHLDWTQFISFTVLCIVWIGINPSIDDLLELPVIVTQAHPLAYMGRRTWRQAPVLHVAGVNISVRLIGHYHLVLLIKS